MLLTRRMAEAGEVVGARLVDHLIVGTGGAWVSLKDRGALSLPQLLFQLRRWRCGSTSNNEETQPRGAASDPILLPAFGLRPRPAPGGLQVAESPPSADRVELIRLSLGDGGQTGHDNAQKNQVVL